MAKSQWWPTEGMIVNVENSFGHHEQKYTIEVRKWGGPLIQRTIKHKTWPPYDVGTRVRVQLSKDDEIRFDPDAPNEMAIISTMDMTAQIAEASAAFAHDRARPTLGEPLGKPDFGALQKVRGGEDVSFVVTSDSGAPVELGAVRGIAAAFKAIAVNPGASVHMVGPDGLQVAVDPAEIKELARAMRSTDQAERKAAIDRWHELRAKALGPGSAKASPVTTAQFSGPVKDSDSVKDRLDRIDILLSEGVLTQAEHDAQRQRILSDL